AAGVELRIDEDLHRQIGAISRGFARRMNRPYVDFETGVRKQATIPEGAHSLGLAGTAPGLVLEAGDSVVVALPGPPGELQRLWGGGGRGGARAPRLPRGAPPGRAAPRVLRASEV